MWVGRWFGWGGVLPFWGKPRESRRKVPFPPWFWDYLW